MQGHAALQQLEADQVSRSFQKHPGCEIKSAPAITSAQNMTEALSQMHLFTAGELIRCVLFYGYCPHKLKAAKAGCGEKTLATFDWLNAGRSRRVLPSPLIMSDSGLVFL